MKHHAARLGKTLAVVVAGALAATVAQWPSIASADTQPVDPSDPTTPVTVAADPLPTVQIDGVAWTQLVVGNTVYVGGKFTTARPAGAAAGSQTTARANLLAYDIRTGNLISSWAPTTNGDVLSLAASPDKSKIYVGGSFTQVNGVTKNRIAALNPTTGVLVGSFAASPDTTVRAIVATTDTVYLGGLFTSVGGTARPRAAAVNASTGALLSWSPNVQGGAVRAMVMSPDGNQLLMGGAFTSVNGSSNPGYGLASVSPSTAASLPWAANGLIRNGGPNAAITSLSTDADSVYATGYVFGSGGNLEGMARMSWTGGTTTWVEDCHGDTYGAYPMGDVIYNVTHAHYCGNLPDGFPQTEPWTMHWGMGFSKATAGTLGADPLGYFNWAGTPSPNLLKWLPNLVNGTFTGQGQAGWSIVGNDRYIAVGGEFPRAGSATQQGLVRYAVRDVAPNKIGPEVTGSKFNPTVTSFARGTAKISWTANWDRDNEELTYSVIRNGIIATPVHTTKQLSSEWSRPAMGFLDTNLTPGETYRYRVFAKDAYGNEARSDTVTVVVSSDGEISSYAQGVLDDGAASYWRFGESTGAVVNDWAGFDNATAGSGVSRGAEGAILGDTNTASTFNGTADGTAVPATAKVASNTFTAETWIKTTSTSGGKIIGYGAAASGNSGSYDRHVYMTNAGRLVFGVYPGSVQTLTSPKSYNDGQWHHVVASLSSSGMALYVDGQRVGSRADIASGQSYTGYWRIGGDNISGWPSQPASFYFNGAIDDVAVYPTALTSSQIRQHYTDSGRTLPGSTAPADDYGKAVYTDEPDFFWRLGEATGPTAQDATPNQVTGTYNGGVTFGGDSAVGAAGDTSITLDGNNGAVATSTSFSNPTTYAQELWFKTSTNRGGKLIGFGAAQFGGSGSYDRHVYMLDDGRLTFGTWTGQTNLINSTSSYNDGKWHHLVAQQGGDGMKLFVDSQLVGTNPQTGAQAYTGYWRVGGDTTWGGNSSNYFAGSIDDVAVYSKTLTAAQVSDHFLKGGGELPNVNPTAAFTFDVTGRTAAFDGTTSTDSDGSVASYAWDFGDGETSTEAKPNHTFTAGDHQVKLTVTDNDGGTADVTRTVTVAANSAPTAAFTADVDKHEVTFDGTESADADGTVASYAWDFGDGEASTAAKPSHTFAAAGDQTVKLTVTDNEGATTAITKTVTTVDNAKPQAAFTTEVNKLKVTFDGSGSSDSDGTVATYAWDFGDGETSTAAKPSHTFAAAGDQTVKLTVTDDEGSSDSITKTVTTEANAKPQAAFTVEVSELKVTFDGSGSSDSDGTVATYAWDFGDGETSTAAKPSHTFAAAGDQTVKLTVTDDEGSSDSITKTVTTEAPSGPLAEDAFSRSASSGWGSADTGGAWSRYGSASYFSVADGSGQMRLASAGAGLRMALESVDSTSTDVAVKVSMDKIAGGGGSFVSLSGRTNGANAYRAKVKVASNGALTLYLVRVVDSAETTLVSTNLGSAYNLTAGGTLNMRVQVTGTSPTTVRAKVWKATQSEPTGWQLTTTDSTSVLQTSGGVGVVGYLSGSATGAPITLKFDDLTAATPE